MTFRTMSNYADWIMEEGDDRAYYDLTYWSYEDTETGYEEYDKRLTLVYSNHNDVIWPPPNWKLAW